jgi:hypothetical protein
MEVRHVGVLVVDQPPSADFKYLVNYYSLGVVGSARGGVLRAELALEFRRKKSTEVIGFRS